ncbi:MAG: aminodeoxychorismate synthase component I [bacterium]|nr:aminodeoxychorismate synthase component I [bacterium]
MRDLRKFLTGLDGGPTVLLQHGEGEDRWLLFRDPVATFAPTALADVLPALAEVEAAAARGLWAAGFLSYEAAPAFDPALHAHEGGALPLVWWGLFSEPRELALGARGGAGTDTSGGAVLDWRSAVTRAAYRRALRRIRAHIAAGDTYQVNYTFPLETPFAGEPEELFAALTAAQKGRYGAYVDIGRFAVCSASPELFFELDGERIVARPMKGTAGRGRFSSEDDLKAAALEASSKDRAENLMIVDMVRNDLGKIAEPGSVETRELFGVETYPTVHQLTSTVSARTGESFTGILRALFPSASITGAPKVSTSRIIEELEAAPRGVYTGSIGFLAPGRRARLNVAIRTATVDRATATATYGTGGGIVWDSDAEAEYEECRAKARVLSPRPSDFALLETLLWRPRSGYFLLERHLDRLTASARYFGFALDQRAVRKRLDRQVRAFEPVRQDVRHRVRLTVQRDGRIEIEAVPFACDGPASWSVVLDDRPVEDSDVFLYHKTTRRSLYEEALRRHPGADEVVLWNARGELTESTRANLALEIDGRWLTPPVRSGLLAGTYRAELLARGRIQEQVLPTAALAEAEKVRLINSVRGWIGVQNTRIAVHEEPEDQIEWRLTRSL